MSGTTQSEQGSSSGTYTMDTPSHHQFMTRRKASTQAAFFIPHLRAGMRVLDVGCGMGTITVGLAEMVAPGEVVGVDIHAQQLENARQLAAQMGVDNVRFESGDAYALPFADGSFDAVFSHAVLEHLADPGKALAEMRRVLRPGGVVGARTTAGGDLRSSNEPLLTTSGVSMRRLYAHRGGDYNRGAQLRGLLHAAGFVRVEASASYECYSTPEATRQWGEMVASLFEGATGEQFIQLGWADRETLDQVAAAWRRWGEHPDSFLARSFGEAVGWCD